MATYATINPADKCAGMTLSNGNLTAVVGGGGNYDMGRSTVGVSSGKWYWEVHNDVAGNGNFAGVHDSTGTLCNAAPWNGNGMFSMISNNDILGVALDMGAGTVSFYVNNVFSRTDTGLTGTMYAGFSLSTGTTTQTTVNFGATAFAYSVPGGFNAGLYIPAPFLPPSILGMKQAVNRASSY